MADDGRARSKGSDHSRQPMLRRGNETGIYAAGRVMRDNNVDDVRDTTVEMAYVKMHFCLSLHSSYEALCDYLAKNHVGELGLEFEH